MTMFRSISRTLARLSRSLGSAEGTTERTAGAVNPALRHVEAAVHQEFPPEELATEEREETES